MSSQLWGFLHPFPFSSLQGLKLFSDLSCYFFHLTPSSPHDTLAADVPSWPTTLPAASTASPAHSSRINVFLPCRRPSHCIIASSFHLCLLQGLGPSFRSSAELHTSVTAPHGDGSAPGLLDFLPMAPPLGLAMFAFTKPHILVLICRFYPLLSPLPLRRGLFGLPLHQHFPLPTPLGPLSKLYLPSAKSIRPCESLPGQRVVASLSLPQPRAWQPVLIACVLQERAQDLRQHSAPKAQPFEQALRQQQQTPGASPPQVSALLGRLSPVFCTFPAAVAPFYPFPHHSSLLTFTFPKRHVTY